MEFALGTETLKTYLSYEVAAAARKLVEQVMLAKPGEQVAITADTASDPRVVEATANAAFAAGAVPVVLWYPTNLVSGQEPPRPVAAAVADSDIWIEYAAGYILYSNAFHRAMERGTRYICLSGVDVDLMTRAIGRANYPRMLQLGAVLQTLLAKAKLVRIVSSIGTSLTADNAGRHVRHSGKLADTPGDPIMLGGQVSWAPREETINGRLVVDACIWPPAEIGLVRTPVTLVIENGVVQRVEGAAEAQGAGALLVARARGAGGAVAGGRVDDTHARVRPAVGAGSVVRGVAPVQRVRGSLARGPIRRRRVRGRSVRGPASAADEHAREQ